MEYLYILKQALIWVLTAFWCYQFVISLCALVKLKDKPYLTNKNHKFMAIIPAHNEEAVVANLIESLKNQTYDKNLYDIYVIADNCTDNTAKYAKEAGAIVYKRFDETKKTKGYALNWFLKQKIEENADYDAFLVFDADNIVDKNFIKVMNRKLCQGEEVVQGYKDIKNPSSDLIFEQSADSIYQWVVGKYGGLFKNMPAEICTYHADILAYHVAVNYDPANRRLNMHVRHMDMEVGGRIWYSEAGLEVSRQEEVILKVCNGYAQPEREHTIQDPGVTFFSYPGYYKTIVDNIGIVNGTECSNRRRIIREEMFGNLLTALKDPERLFPIVVIVSRETQDGMMDEDWLGQFRVSDFTRTVWRYSHVFTAHESVGKKFLRLAGIDLRQIDDIPRLYIFWPGGDVDDYGPEDVTNCSFGRHLEARGDARTYDIVRGGQAFYHKIVTDLREWNISADMWEGFKLETVTELPK